MFIKLADGENEVEESQADQKRTRSKEEEKGSGLMWDRCTDVREIWYHKGRFSFERKILSSQFMREQAQERK